LKSDKRKQSNSVCNCWLAYGESVRPKRGVDITIDFLGCGILHADTPSQDADRCEKLVRNVSGGARKNDILGSLGDEQCPAGGELIEPIS
jgi:hypothetical protein